MGSDAAAAPPSNLSSLPTTTSNHVPDNVNAAAQAAAEALRGENNPFDKISAQARNLLDQVVSEANTNTPEATLQEAQRAITASVQNVLNAHPQDEVRKLIDATPATFQTLKNATITSAEALSAHVTDILANASPQTASLSAAAVAVAVTTYVAYRVLATPVPVQYGSEDSLPARWDPEAAEFYFARRPVRVLRRVAEIAAVAAPFFVNLWLDKQFYHSHDDEKTSWPLPKRSRAHRQAERGRELTRILTKLGPTFIKVGQSLSIREDLLPAEYTAALRELQDRLPPFEEDLAQDILRKEWRVSSPSEVLTLLDAAGNAVSYGGRPIAAASLGQVYRGFLTLSDGTPKQVAVKVQRPNMAEVIALDLFLMRCIATPFRDWQNLNTDLEGVVDEWGRGFTQELDYIEEAASAERFTLSMKEAGIDSVRAPTVVSEYTTSCVLVTEWIDGVRLDEAGAEASQVAEVDGMAASNVPRLCGVALLSYLTMLLDVGILHSDPHPGNLLIDRSDGALVILDWGLVTYISPEKQIAILEYVAHLANEEWDAVPNDLVAMGFVPSDKVEVVLKEPEVIQAISLGLKGLTKGGGMKEKISNVSVVADELNYARERYGNVFQVPSYFAYILRAFAILEGICLKIDPTYAIVKECYPYLSRRLFTDNNPRVIRALESLLYGAEPLPSPGEPRGRQLNIARLERLVGAYRRSSAYAAESASAASASAAGLEDEPTSRALPEEATSMVPQRWSLAEAEASVSANTLRVDSGALEILRLVLSPQETHLQRLVVYEAARAIDALSREALLAVAAGTLPRWPGSSLPASFAAFPGSNPSPSTPGLPWPFSVGTIGRATSLSREDVETLETVRRLANLFFPDPMGAMEEDEERRQKNMPPPPPPPLDAIAFAASAVRNATAAAMIAAELAPELLPGALALGGRLALKLQERALVRLFSP